MRAEDIKPGMWLRHAWGNLWRVADRGAPDRWKVRCVDGREGVLCDGHAAMWDPWTPRVGEWVRSEATGTVFVVELLTEADSRQSAFGRTGFGSTASVDVSLLAPCLPPKAEGKAGLDTSAIQEAAQAAVETLQAYQAHQVAEAAPQAKVQRIRVTSAQIGGVDVSEDFFAFTDLMDARYRAHQAAQPKACDCRRCTGPVATLLTMPCQGEDWRKAEPNTYEVWVEPMTGRWVPAGSRTVPFDGAELAYHAAGRGLIRQHPIREEAIRLWREAVR